MALGRLTQQEWDVHKYCVIGLMTLHKDMRYGQAVSLTLQWHLPEVFRKINNTELDPFYCSSRVSVLYKQLNPNL